MKKILLFAVMCLAVASFGTVAAAKGGPVTTGTLEGTNTMAPPPFPPPGGYVFLESGTITLPKLAGPYTLNFNRPFLSDYAVGVFAFSAAGGTLTGVISATNYVTCVEVPNSVCMDVVISPLAFTGKGPLEKYEGGSFTLYRHIFGAPVGEPRDVSGTVEARSNGDAQN